MGIWWRVVGRGGVPEGIYSSTAEIQDRRATTYPAETRLPCPGTVYPAGKLPTLASLPCRRAATLPGGIRRAIEASRGGYPAGGERRAIGVEEVTLSGGMRRAIEATRGGYPARREWPFGGAPKVEIRNLPRSPRKGGRHRWRRNRRWSVGGGGRLGGLPRENPARIAQKLV